MPVEHSGARVLVVDDDATVLQFVGLMLEQAGFVVETHASGHAALAAIRNDPDSFDVLLSDIVMPGMGGVELAQKAREIVPGLPVCFMSGYCSLDLLGAPFLSKPFRTSDLLAAIETLPIRRKQAGSVEIGKAARSGAA